MKMRKLLALAFVSALFAYGCTDDDSTPDPDPTPARQATIVGSWISKKGDVAPLLSGLPLNVDSIFAQFNKNNTYTVATFSTSGTRLDFSGSYTTRKVDTAQILEITLNQSAPATLTSEGIFRVWLAGTDSMYYEVAQTAPSIVGVTKPTIAGGFGSTSGGAFGTINIQKYRRFAN
jgi:hypothetical protein